MDLEFFLNILDSVLIIGISIPCIYMGSRLNQSRLRFLTILLSGFLLVHGLYHATAAIGALQGYDFVGTLSDIVIEPVGWLIFLVFAVYLSRLSS